MYSRGKIAAIIEFRPRFHAQYHNLKKEIFQNVYLPPTGGLGLDQGKLLIIGQYPLKEGVVLRLKASISDLKRTL
jgi:hypothetical protein